jgi:hypothetical protein
MTAPHWARPKAIGAPEDTTCADCGEQIVLVPTPDGRFVWRHHDEVPS